MSMLSLAPLMFFHTLAVSLTCLSVGFFFSEMTIGPMWALPMDIAPDYCGTASGMMNIGSALAAILSPVASGYLIDRFGNWELPFVGSMLLMAAGAVLAFRMRPGQEVCRCSPASDVASSAHAALRLVRASAIRVGAGSGVRSGQSSAARMSRP